MNGAYQPVAPPPEVPDDPKAPRGLRRFTVKRAERHAAMAAQSWPDFFRDLGIRFAVAAAVVLVIAGALWLFAR